MVIWLYHLRAIHRSYTLLCKYLPKTCSINFVSTSPISKINASLNEGFDKFNVTKESFSSSKLERTERPSIFQTTLNPPIKIIKQHEISRILIVYRQ